MCLKMSPKDDIKSKYNETVSKLDKKLNVCVVFYAELLRLFLHSIA